MTSPYLPTLTEFWRRLNAAAAACPDPKPASGGRQFRTLLRVADAAMVQGLTNQDVVVMRRLTLAYKEGMRVLGVRNPAPLTLQEGK